MALPITQTRSYMLAHRVPLLEGKELFDQLREMDETEETTLTKEEAEFKRKSDLFDEANKITNFSANFFTWGGQ
jgi:hypothetical protein